MSKKILIFGGSGFIGSSLTLSLINKKNEVCVICTDIKKAQNNLKESKYLSIKNIDIFDEKELQNIVKEYDVIINLIGKLFEARKGDFKKFHHEFPQNLSNIISDKQKLIHVGALGVEKSAKTSKYAKTKLDGQNAVIENSKNYNIIKPSIVFGQKDNFFNLFAKMTKISPFLPLIGGGKAKFSPIYVEDLTNSIIKLIGNKKFKNQIFEAYGNKTATFKELMQFILKTINKKRLLLTLPFFAAKLQAKIMNLVKIYLLTSDQVELLKYHNIKSGKYDNIDKIIGNLSDYQKIVPTYLNNDNKK